MNKKMFCFSTDQLFRMKDEEVKEKKVLYVDEKTVRDDFRDVALAAGW